MKVNIKRTGSTDSLRSVNNKPNVNYQPTQRLFPKPSFTHFTVLHDSNERMHIPWITTMRWCPPGYRTSSLLTIGNRGVNLGRVEHGRGDITLEGYTHVVSIERKYKMSELNHNINTGTFERQMRVMSSLVKHPYLLLDFPITDMYGTGGNSHYRDEDPTPTILDKVFPIIHDYKVKLIGPVTARARGPRKALSQLLVHIMLSHIKDEDYVPYRMLQK